MEAVKTCSTKSSSFVPTPLMPEPPLCWLLKAETGQRLIYPECVTVMTVVSLAIRSSILRSSAEPAKAVRRSSL